MNAPSIPNVLAQRYASSDMRHLWSAENKVVSERRLWIALLRAQRSLGISVPDQAVGAYEAVVDKVDLLSIRARERVTRHDVKARIEEFCALAGYEEIHKGMTSRDLTENVEQMQVRDSLNVVRDRMVASLARLSDLAVQHANTVLTGRTHNVPAQAITLGKRFANAGEELLYALERIEQLIADYPLRGVKGPVGTQQDQLDLLSGDLEKVAKLEAAVAKHLGFKRILTNVGQVYPRSLDFEVVSSLLTAISGPSNLATTIRLMAGHELLTEGFKAGQVGSSAMPHKMNTRSCERINGFKHVLCELGAFPAIISRELDRYLPFLATTKVLMAAVRAGKGREQAHEAIKQHAVAVALEMREGRDNNDLVQRLAADKRLGLSASELSSALEKPLEFVGAAPEQVRAFATRVEAVVARHPNAARYQPEPML